MTREALPGKWAAVATTPEGAALADAYLNLRSELQTLIVYVQGAERGVGMSVQALRQHAESLTPLLDEPTGRAWTAAYFAAAFANSQAAGILQRHREGLAKGHRHDWLIDDALTALTKGAP